MIIIIIVVFSKTFTCNDAFIGYTEDTCPSIVMELCKNGCKDPNQVPNAYFYIFYFFLYNNSQNLYL